MSKEKLRAAIRRRRQRNSDDTVNVRDFLQGAAAEEAEQLFDELRDHILAMAQSEIKELVSKVKKGNPGEEGKPGPKGEPGKSIRGPEGKQGKPGRDGRGIKGDRGEAGKDGREISKKELLKKINDIDNGIKIKTISGLDAFLKNLQRAIREKVVGGAQKRGGGMTIEAGSNITLTRQSNGIWVVASTAAGGSNILTEQVTAVQSGDHVTIDLTQLANTSTGVLLVTRNGQVLLPNGSAGLPGSSWSQSGSTVTVYNADASEIFLVQYMYA
jgi:hypothetical protein